MKAVIYNKSKAHDVFVSTDAEKPVPKGGEVLINVVTAAINAADCRVLKLGMIPKSRIFGSAIAGTIEAVGRGVGKFTVGDAVCADIAESGFGGLAEYVAVPEKLLAKKPAGMTFETAAALPLAAVTALQALRKGGIKAGQKVLIIGAGGGVGTFAVQLARHLGAEVTAVCGNKNVPVVRSLGAEHVIDYTKTDFTKNKKRYDLLLAVNGKYPLPAYKHMLTKNGVCIVVGGALSQVIKTLLFGPLLSLGSRKMRVLSATPDANDLEYILKLTEEGSITPVIDRRYPLSDAAEAMKYALEGHVQGKVVVEVTA
jgi:NADPH:quinone reductase-like Zn-dependent oxidoreductase